MTKCDIPLYYISLDGKKSFDYDKYFSNVNHFKAIDLRNIPAKKLFEDKLITLTALNSIENGRKWHSELPGAGAVGLWQSNRILLEKLKNTKENVIICEQDCIIKNPEIYCETVKKLKGVDFDLAVFGTHILKKTNLNEINMNKNKLIESYKNDIQDKLLKYSDLPKIPINFSNFKGDFVLLHNVVWSPKGINKILKYLNEPQDMQLDALFSKLSQLDILKVLIHDKKNTNAVQDYHPSTLNNDSFCLLCDTEPNLNINMNYNISYTFIMILILLISIIFILIITQKKCN